ncbi:Inactive pancreatic lipase-related protein 1 like protein [Argiope bruennichi]|uniref:Inactive pancreatic lipase-related protein 1 like protein n=1 Tax=Argiope bruennichi TaxID=94029 RepID=A0A8T0EUM3_ARGBR|nr:Inactive pancreatic lipase-related protein 1 like protein [Argiope bruennichi]
MKSNRTSLLVKQQESLANLFKTVCYPDVGCFYTGPPFFQIPFRPISPPPSNQEGIGTTFLLYTRKNRRNPVVFTPLKLEPILKSHFNSSLWTRLIVHGFLDGTYTMSWNLDLKDQFLLSADENVIVVDTSSLSLLLVPRIIYPQTVADSRAVGVQVAQLITFLHENLGVDMGKIHIIGHSLGAHIGGYAGERLPKLGRITGLDPAGPWYRKVPKNVELDDTDATFVDVIHSNPAPFVLFGFGTDEDRGHINFWPSGGIQRGYFLTLLRVFSNGISTELIHQYQIVVYLQNARNVTKSVRALIHTIILGENQLLQKDLPLNIDLSIPRQTNTFFATSLQRLGRIRSVEVDSIEDIVISSKAFIEAVEVNYLFPEPRRDSEVKFCPSSTKQQGKLHVFSSDYCGLFKTVCYPDVGCFYTGPPFFQIPYRPINRAPSPPEMIRATFLHFTRKNKHNPMVIAPEKPAFVFKSHLNPEAWTRIIIHGYLDGSYSVTWMFDLKDEFLRSADDNVIVVDSSSLSLFLLYRVSYIQASTDTRVIGAQVANLITFLHKNLGVDLKKVHIVGHSLGTEVAGYAGERLSNLGRITALEPAGPLFRYTDRKVQIDDSDATFMDAIHTDAGPITLLVMHVIFCKHQKVVDMFMHSFNQSNCMFVGVECTSWKDFLQGKCNCGDNGERCSFMGAFATPQPPPRRSVDLSASKQINTFLVFSYQPVGRIHSVEASVPEGNEGATIAVEAIEINYLYPM